MAHQLEEAADAALKDRRGTSNRPVVLPAMCLLALPLFLGEKRARRAAGLLPLALFRVRACCGAIIATATMMCGNSGLVFPLPFVWQSLGHLSPREAGSALIALSLVFFVVSTRSGAPAHRLGTRAMTSAGTALIGCGLLIIAASEAGYPMPLVQSGLMLAGLGMGLNSGPLCGIAAGPVGGQRSGTAAAMADRPRVLRSAPPDRPYRPLKTGLRFSLKARMPSRRSSVGTVRL